jgi:hypothetical protein
VTGDILDDCFRYYRYSAFRFETLPAYDAGGEEAERIRAWRLGLPVPDRSVRTSEYLREVAAGTLAGRQWRRIRIADEPLSEYLRYELVAYAESAAAGEEILIAVRGGGTPEARKALAGIATDFCLFDSGTENETCVLMEYEAGGTFTAARLATAVDHRYCRRLWDKAAAHAVPLNEYLARTRRRTAAA